MTSLAAKRHRESAGDQVKSRSRSSSSAFAQR